MAASCQTLLADSEYKVRLITFLNEGEKYLRYLFHHPKYGNFPNDEGKLYKVMVKLDNGGKLNYLLSHQRPLVLPKNKKTDSKTFDLSQFSYFLLNCANLPKHVRENIEGIRDERNAIIHKPNIAYSEFLSRWTHIEKCLQSLGYDINIVKDLKSGSLDDLEHFQVSINKARIESQQKEIDQYKDDNLQNKDDILQNKNDILQNKGDINKMKEDVKTHDERLNKLEHHINFHDHMLPKSELEENKHKQVQSDKEKNSFILYKNIKENIIVHFHDENITEAVKVTITKGHAKAVSELHAGKHYHEDKQDNNLVITFYKQAMEDASDLIITVKTNKENIEFAIKDVLLVCVCCYVNKNNGFLLRTHNSIKIYGEIEQITNAEVVESDIKFVCCGTLQRMSENNYSEFSKKYIGEYFTMGGKFIKESIQFPPPVANEKISQFGYRIKNVLSNTKDNLFIIFTHYNTVENLRLLNLDNQFLLSVDETTDSKNRILLFHPNGNTFINIRYTDTKPASIIQQQFQIGEEDIKHLAAVNRLYVSSGEVSFINALAAPNFVKKGCTSLCKDCLIMDEDVLRSDANIGRYISNLLNANKNVSERSKEVYMSIAGQIMVSMAAREGLHNVPTIKDEVHEKIGTLILSSQQLRFLYDQARKKIIIGPLGSGKTTLALSHLEWICEHCEVASVIYYVVWHDKTLLMDQVKKFATNLRAQRNASLVIRNVIELAKELNLSKQPTVSQIMLSLLKKHENLPFHLIGDEVDGEMFDESEALTLGNILYSRMVNSFVILFPRSLEKHRTFVSPEERKEHNKYKYKQTDMEVFYLNKAMRTPNRIFNFLTEFERKVSLVDTVIKHPVDNTRNIMPHLKQKTTSLEREKRTIYCKEKRSTDLPYILPLKSATTKPQKKAIELSMDIDVLAAMVDDTVFPDGVKTMTKLKCNTADLIGHNIQGEKPIFLHINNIEKQEEDAIVTLALALENICFDRKHIKSLYFYQNENQRNMFRKVLLLLEKKFLDYGEDTDVKVLPPDEGYNLLSNINGTRGMEFSEVVCAVDLNDTKLRHITLEGMSRSTGSLILTSPCSLDSAIETESSMVILSESCYQII